MDANTEPASSLDTLKETLTSAAQFDPTPAQRRFLLAGLRGEQRRRRLDEASPAISQAEAKRQRKRARNLARP